MLIAMVPTAAFAENKNSGSITIEGKEGTYNTIAEAVEAAKPGDTIVLTSDITLTETVTIDKSVTIDLGGNTITISGYEGNGIGIGSSEAEINVLLTGGTIIDERGKNAIATGDNTIYIEGCADVTTSDLIVKAYAPNSTASPYYNYLLRICPAGTGADAKVGSLTLDNGTKLLEIENINENYGAVGITAMGPYSNGNDVPQNYEGVKVTVKDGVEIKTTGYALTGNGTKHGTTFIIRGSLTSYGSTGIYHPQMGNITVSDTAVITGENTGIEVRAGDINITGGTITGLATPTEVEPNGNGTTSTGAGVAVVQHTTKLPINVNISGGTINGYSAVYEKNIQNNPQEDIDKVNIEIRGGSFNAINEGTVAVYSENEDDFITGGTFSANPSAYVNEETHAVVKESENYKVLPIADAAVAKIGDKYYLTLAEAIEKVEAEQTIALIDDITLTEHLTITKAVTINGNNHTITYLNGENGVQAIYADSNAKLTLNQVNITTDKDYAVNAFDLQAEGISIVINGGTFKGGLKVVSYGDGTTVSVSDTVINATGTYDSLGVVNVTGCTAQLNNVTVNGGKYTSFYIGGGSNVTVSGGTYTTSDTVEDNQGTEIENPVFYVDNGILKITGGTFTGVYSVNQNDGSLTITGGTFSADPTKYVASGYSVKESDGKYTVYYPSTGGGTTTPSDPGETVTNPDGSTTTTVTKPDGTVTETTKQPDGSTTVTTTKPDGSSVTTVDNKDGSSSKTTVSAEGKTESDVKLPSAVVDNAEKNGEAVELPIPEVTASKDADKAPKVTVDLPAGRSAKVEIPVDNVNAGVVAVLVHADGTEEIIKTSVPTENGIEVKVEDGATLKIVDNSKDFADVAESHWGADAVDFAASREIFDGTSETTFEPETAMTRAMVVTVLARLDGVDTAGDVWYEAGAEWAKENGISDGTNLNAMVSREQLVTMLYRYAGSPEVEGQLAGYPDAESVSDYAEKAMIWAVENGIITGADGKIAPQGDATRVQVAAILMRFIDLMQ